MELGREFPSANVVSESLGRTQFPSVECETFAKSGSHVRPSDLQFLVWIGPKCYTFAKFALQLLVLLLLRSVKCLTVVKNRGRAMEHPSTSVVSKALGRTSLQSVEFDTFSKSGGALNKASMGGVKIARSHFDR